MIRIIIPPRGSRKIGEAGRQGISNPGERLLVEVRAGEKEAKVISWVRFTLDDPDDSIRTTFYLFNPEKIVLAIRAQGEVLPIHALIPSGGSLKIKAARTSGTAALSVAWSYYGWTIPDQDLYFGRGVLAP